VIKKYINAIETVRPINKKTTRDGWFDLFYLNLMD